jgi:hypothetical protein
MESLMLSSTRAGAESMADVPIRHSAIPTRQPPARRRASWSKPLILFAGIILLVIAFGGLFQASIELYHDRMVLTGLTDDPKPVSLTIGVEDLRIPANMLRFEKARSGGPLERADLALHWPNLEGFSAPLEDAFREGAASAGPIIYATIAPRDSAQDATGRLDSVYARFFVEKAVAGPAGLVGRKLSADSGYGGEIVYFVPKEPRPFVARCLAGETGSVPATCLRDINIGRSLSLLYRFNRSLLADWRTLDAGMQKMAAGFLAK